MLQFCLQKYGTKVQLGWTKLKIWTSFWVVLLFYININRQASPSSPLEADFNWFLLCPPKGQTLTGDAPLTKAKNTTGCLRQPRLKLSECLVLWPLLLKEVLHFFVTPVLPFALNNMAQDRVVVEMLQNFWACWDLWKSAEKSCNGLGRRWIPLPPWATCKGDNGASLLLDIILDVFNPLVTRVANIVPYGPMTYFLSKQCSFNITDSILH